MGLHTFFEDIFCLPHGAMKQKLGTPLQSSSSLTDPGEPLLHTPALRLMDFRVVRLFRPRAGTDWHAQGSHRRSASPLQEAIHLV